MTVFRETSRSFQFCRNNFIW